MSLEEIFPYFRKGYAMKWPRSITLIRHGQSEYNILKGRKEADPLYQEFKQAYEKNHTSTRAKFLAKEVMKKFALGVSDYGTKLTEEGAFQSMETGMGLREAGHPVPDVILCSPYLRTRKTLEGIGRGWEINVTHAIMDDRIREQEHGLSLLYNDWRVFHVFHPEQKGLRELLGAYYYPYPQGESAANVRDRVRLMTGTIIREYAGKDVLIVTHHLTILSILANFERMSPEQFLEMDHGNKPINCGVTLYEGDPTLGKNGKLVQRFYNKKFY